MTLSNTLHGKKYVLNLIYCRKKKYFTQYVEKKYVNLKINSIGFLVWNINYFQEKSTLN